MKQAEGCPCAELLFLPYYAIFDYSYSQLTSPQNNSVAENRLKSCSLLSYGNLDSLGDSLKPDFLLVFSKVPPF